MMQYFEGISMSDTLTSLRNKIFDDLMDADFCGSEAIIQQVLEDNIGENARRMLQIGIVQDSLVELGFEFGPKKDYPAINFMFHDKSGVAVNFYTKWVFVHVGGRIYYDSPTWQQDLLARVRELIGDKS